MPSRKIDLDKLHVALHRMSRANLLVVAQRAIEIVPRSKLQVLLGDLIHFDEIAEARARASNLLDEVGRFHAGSLAGDYYESFRVNSTNFMDRSEGTQAFIAEFDRLVGKCVRAAAKRPQERARKAFELLFDLLRRIDEDTDSVIFLADEAGSWQVGVAWREVLPAYFLCLAASTSSDEFACEVDRVIRDFADDERPKHLTAARRVASAEQKAALRRLSSRDKRPWEPRRGRS